MLRIVHTADWHLGHVLHGISRGWEHDQFLHWLEELLVERRVDALLVAGDIFDNANPPAAALAAWYDFLARIRRRLPNLDVVAIGGNHDSAGRLDAPQPLLSALELRIVGGARRSGEPRQPSEFLFPLTDADGAVAAWVAAVPYLRVADLPPVADEGSDPLIAGVREVYRHIVEAARERATPGQALIGMGHCYLANTALSELSERRILGGNQHALPRDVFPADLAYVALGHLHRAQRVGDAEPPIRYSGSPIPLSMAERTYNHQVVIAEIEGAELREVEAVEVPRLVPFVRVPARGALSAEAAVAAVEALGHSEAPAAGAPSAASRPAGFLEVVVELAEPRPELRAQLLAAIDGKGWYLARIQRLRPQADRATPERATSTKGVQVATVEEVFRERWSSEFPDDPPAGLMERLAIALEHAGDAVGGGGGQT